MKTILIIDDDKTNLVTAKETLKDLYKIIAVTSGAQALSYVEKWIPDLILLDLNMPEMDGFEVFDRLHQMPALSNIPVIFLTGDSDPNTETKCLEIGALDFISKPFVPMVIRSRIARTLELEELRRSLASRLDSKIREVSAMKELSSKDPLTGLWNRSYTKELVSKKLENGESGSLFMLDMDNFKIINDCYGHMAGDHVLKIMAEVLSSNVGPEDVVCRLGGDEFILYYADLFEPESTATKAQTVLASLNEKIKSLHFDTNTSVSIGIAQCPSDGNDFDSLYNKADKALYFVKQNGKSGYHFYSDKKEDELARNSSTVDIRYLKDIMKRSDAGAGSYLMEYSNFHHVYNFIRRYVERTNQEVMVVLYTFNPDKDTSPASMQMACDLFEDSVYNSLRRVDVVTRYSSHQFVVLLVGTNAQNAAMVADRILEHFNLAYPETMPVTYDMVELP